MSSEAWGLVDFGMRLLVLPLLVVLLARVGGLDLHWLPLQALARATVQLSLVALILRGVLDAPALIAAFIALMLTTASLTASGRIAGLHRGRRVAVAGVLAGAAAALLVIFALRLVDTDGTYVIAVAGIVIGNSMTAATLAGRMFARAAQERRGEIEAWLALGASPSLAHADIGRTAAREALLPGLDQTRSTGLVTLPGAFVGALFGGASPVEAAQFQLVVLAGIGLAMTVTALVVTQLAGRTPYVLPSARVVPVPTRRGSRRARQVGSRVPRAR